MASTSSHGHRRRLALPLPPLPLPLLLSLLLAVLFGGARGQPCDTAALVDQAQSVIRKNYDAAHGWTVPSPGVAPFLVRACGCVWLDRSASTFNATNLSESIIHS